MISQTRRIEIDYVFVNKNLSDAPIRLMLSADDEAGQYFLKVFYNILDEDVTLLEYSSANEMSTVLVNEFGIHQAIIILKECDVPKTSFLWNLNGVGRAMNYGSYTPGLSPAMLEEVTQPFKVFNIPNGMWANGACGGLTNPRFFSASVTAAQRFRRKMTGEL